MDDWSSATRNCEDRFIEEGKIMQYFDEKISSQNTKECPACKSKDIDTIGFFGDNINGEDYQSYRCLNPECEIEWYNTEEIRRDRK